ncbi:ankyrin repeat domain-containing protein [Leptospira levettii]|uniref:Ankyrin repeat domain-containing protein n=1 Tax=Leptospira levettii TaxID=2023178 RepID=A0AAW5V1G8_9LEPT|nr:ankyrin repeat domain-containing protein [Leptospira levettii]MCW7466648.1 ankyrin repeat domain-containing protein [Leptospira levettii]MCW7511786.1 ankyrin repeat domain-containing protein [Leptospira levettii]MCW7515546.1 ankyrin repeat domain-containing protein [Leptospira levettii]
MKKVSVLFLLLLSVSCKTIPKFQVIDNVKPNPNCKITWLTVVEPDFFIMNGSTTLAGCIEKLGPKDAVIAFSFGRSIHRINASVNLTTGESRRSDSYSSEGASAKTTIQINKKASLEIPTGDKKGSFMFSILYSLKNKQPSIEIYDVTREESYGPRLAFYAITNNDLPKLKELFAKGSIQNDTHIILVEENNAYELNLFQHALNVRANWEIYDYLLEKKVNYQFRDKNGFNALTYAVYLNDIGLVKYIDSLKKWNLNETTNQGDTVLHWASANQNKEIVEYLLKRGTDKNIKNNQGLTAYDIAKTKSSREILEILQ